MKKLLMPLLLLLSFSSLGSTDFGIKHHLIDQKVSKNVRFNQSAMALEANKWFDNFGIGVLVARSVDTPNKFFIKGKDYRNKIKVYTKVTGKYKYQVTEDLELYVEGGYVDYRTKWSVNGVAPSWADGKDSGWGHGIGLNYNLGKAWINFNYGDYYSKPKGSEVEETKEYSLGLFFRF